MGSRLLLALGTVMALAAWIFVILRFDPFSDGWIAHALFYIALGMFLWGVFTLLGVMIKVYHKKFTMLSRFAVGMIARQALLLTFFLLAVLYLMAHSIMRWWNIIPLAILIGITEWFFFSLHDNAGRISKTTDLPSLNQ